MNCDRPNCQVRRKREGSSRITEVLRLKAGTNPPDFFVRLLESGILRRCGTCPTGQPEAFAASHSTSFKVPNVEATKSPLEMAKFVKCWSVSAMSPRGSSRTKKHLPLSSAMKLSFWGRWRHKDDTLCLQCGEPGPLRSARQQLPGDLPASCIMATERLLGPIV